MTESARALAERDKRSWRARAKANRAGLVISHDRIVVGLRRHFERHPTSGWIVGFDPLPGEPDLRPLAAEDWGRFALTRTPEPSRSMDLSVHPWDGPTEQHRYGFRQPVASAPLIPIADIGAVLVPGLAFDMHGNRLGHGAGYYDRFLARLDPAVERIGVSDGYIVSRLPTDEHDIAMTHLATEAGVMELGSASTKR